MNILLPPLPDREALRGFRGSLSALVGVFVGAVALVAGLANLPGAIAGGLGTTVLLVLASGRRERLAAKAYVKWNRYAKRYAQWARGTISAIWYWTVFTVVSRTGDGEMTMAQTDWRPRGTLPPDAYADPGGASTDREGSGGIRDLAGWAARAGRPWTLVLVPLFGILRALETSGRKKPVADIYTLY